MFANQRCLNRLRALGVYFLLPASFGSLNSALRRGSAPGLAAVRGDH
jgi:hypothetical protein